MAKILAVDDDPDSLGVIRQIFETRGHRVTLALNGDQAIDLFKTNRDDPKSRFDVVLTDMTMPGGILGTDVGRMIQGFEMGRTDKKTPVVLYTGRMSGNFEGISAVVPKPCQASHLFAIVTSLANADDLLRNSPPM